MNENFITYLFREQNYWRPVDFSSGELNVGLNYSLFRDVELGHL